MAPAWIRDDSWQDFTATAMELGFSLHVPEKDQCGTKRTPGVEPGSQAWEACMIPLHYVRCKSHYEARVAWWKIKPRAIKPLQGGVQGEWRQLRYETTATDNELAGLHSNSHGAWI